jgi:hypothetical protein
MYAKSMAVKTEETKLSERPKPAAEAAKDKKKILRGKSTTKKPEKSELEVPFTFLLLLTQAS